MVFGRGGGKVCCSAGAKVVNAEPGTGNGQVPRLPSPTGSLRPRLRGEQRRRSWSKIQRLLSPAVASLRSRGAVRGAKKRLTHRGHSR